MKAGHKCPDLISMRKEIQKSKGDQWGARGKFYKDAIQEVEQ